MYKGTTEIYDSVKISFDSNSIFNIKHRNNNIYP